MLPDIVYSLEKKAKERKKIVHKSWRESKRTMKEFVLIWLRWKYRMMKLKIRTIY